MSVAEKVKEIIVDQLGVDASEVNPEAKFVDDLGADSLDLTELIMAMEEEFGVEISDEDAQLIQKVQDAISFIEKKKASRPSNAQSDRGGPRAAPAADGSTMTLNRVVVTGLAAITPIGNDLATSWRNLLDGVSGAAPITRFDAAAYDTRFACEVKNFDEKAFIAAKLAKRLDRFTIFAMSTAMMLMEDAGYTVAPKRRRMWPSSSAAAWAAWKPWKTPIPSSWPRGRPGCRPFSSPP